MKRIITRMLDFSTNIPSYSMDLLDEVKLFFLPAESNGSLFHELTVSGNSIHNIIVIDGQKYAYSCAADGKNKSEIKREAKHSLYLALKSHTGRQPPWGSLTGVRPTKLAYEYLNRGGNTESLPAYFSDRFDVTPAKAKLMKEIVLSQSGYINDLCGTVNLYIHVPFCPSRCNYCSFPSEVTASGEKLSAYTELLVRETEATLELIRKQNKRVLSVYIGGGTPSVLSGRDIKRVLDTVKHLDVEKTFEAGRPDSINADKLETIKEGGVGRMCINPQTLNDKTLERIGRRHTSRQFFEQFAAARRLGFDINTDIIAGLDGEDIKDFTYTLNGILPLDPENITVHTLSRKRASDNAEKTIICGDIDKMLSLASEEIARAGYNPYYLYKQKYMAGNQENTGYSKRGKECVNNITVMEELVPVYACGAGAISKSINGGVIARYQNAKDIKLYTDEFEPRLLKKLNFCQISLQSYAVVL